jgi:hypothetical protein
MMILQEVTGRRRSCFFMPTQDDRQEIHRLLTVFARWTLKLDNRLGGLPRFAEFNNSALVD